MKEFYVFVRVNNMDKKEFNEKLVAFGENLLAVRANLTGSKKKVSFNVLLKLVCLQVLNSHFNICF